MQQFALWFNALTLAYVTAVAGAYLAMMGVSFLAVTSYRRSVAYQRWRRTLQSPLAPGVSIVIPAFNESKSITDSVRSMLQTEYPLFEVVVVNDGSGDDTIRILTEEFSLQAVPIGIVGSLPCRPILGLYRTAKFPRLVVVDKKNGGKADALNAGVNLSKYPLFCAVDADSLLDGGALLRVVKPFQDNPRRTVAVGGIVRVANGCVVRDGQVVNVGVARSWWGRLQTVEYLRAFLFGRSGLAAIRALLIVSGAFGVFKKEAVIAVGGYRTDTVGEDIELVVRLHRYFRERKQAYQVLFLPDPVCWTQVPDSWSILGKQRNRWQRGLIHTLDIHKSLFFNPRYGVVGLVAYPYFFFVEMLGPLVEILGYIVITSFFIAGLLSLESLILYLAVSTLSGVLLSTGSLVLEEIAYHKYLQASHVLTLFCASLAEGFGYRQLTLWWRLSGTLSYIRKQKAWGRMEHQGFS